ncbi:MAG: hypothetical protein ACK4YP_01885 [Myxococcota bacterium]
MITTLLLGLSTSAHAQGAPDNWKFSLDGYYRVRANVFGDLYQGQEKAGTYMLHRVRLQPELNFEDRAKFVVMADALDGVAWGDNASLASTALFAGDPSLTGIEGQEITPIQVKRAWMEFKVPVGLLRVGRQGSQWGMGLLANDGNGFDDTFGENKYGATYDRAIFATRPISIVQTIAGKRDTGIPLIVAVGVDRLVEDPLIQYYGYGCTLDQTAEDGEDPRCEETENHGYTEERDASRRAGDWWVDPEDDVWEMVYVVRYAGEGIKLPGGQVGDLTVGAYVVNRKQTETESDVLILDGYLKAEVAGAFLEGEILNIRGDTRAITLTTTSDAEGVDPLYKKADIWGYVVRGGYQTEILTVGLEHGFASGDSNVPDANFTGRPLSPDHNVGLIMYEEILSRVTATTWSEDARGLWSNGGVYNSRYVFPVVRVRPLDNWEIIGGFLTAWPDEPDGARIRCTEAEANDPERGLQCGNSRAAATSLGWEADLAIKHRWHDHVNFTLEGGYAHISDRVPLKSVGLGYYVNSAGQEVGNYWTLQSRIAYEF